MDLLAREPERFPGVTDCLLLSAPDKFLKVARVDYPIAQKYGNTDINALNYLHAAGIVFTEEPIVLCVLTCNLLNQYALMGGFTELMCEYTEHDIAARAEAARLEAEERERLAAEERERLTAEERERLAAEERERLAAEELRFAAEGDNRLRLYGLVVFPLSLAVVLLFRSSGRKRRHF